MFTLINESDKEEGETFHSVTLILKYQGLELVFIPEHPEAIKNIDIRANSGCFDTRPSNGAFRLTWSPELIVIQCARNGDGNGGAMSVVLETTPKLLMSLQLSLKKWKALMAN